MEDLTFILPVRIKGMYLTNCMKQPIYWPMWSMIALFVAINLFPQICRAKVIDHTVQGQVADAITGDGLDSARVILMTSDSIPLDTTQSLPKIAG